MFNRKLQCVKKEGITGITSYLTFSSDSGDFTITATKHWDGTLYYSKDHIVWFVWKGNSIRSKDGYLYFAGKDNTIITGERTGSVTRNWTLSGTRIACSGNIETLLDWEEVSAGHHPPMGEYCFSELFCNQTALIQAPTLGATQMSAWCYYAMLCDCTNVTIAPVLPSTQLAEWCYCLMLSGTGIHTPPNLPATNVPEGAYSEMFDTTPIETAPILLATGVAGDSYSSICRNCHQLRQLPKLKIRNFTANMEWAYYGMFSECPQMKFSLTQTSECPNAYRIPYTGTGTLDPSLEHVFEDLFYGTTGYFTDNEVDPEINVTYYTNMEVV